MGKVNRVLLMMIAMVSIMVAAVGIDRGMQHYETVKWEKEREERYRQVYADAADIQMTISQLSDDQKAIEEFIEENREYFDEIAELDWQQEEGFLEGEHWSNSDKPDSAEGSQADGMDTMNEDSQSELSMNVSVSDDGIEVSEGISGNDIGDIQENSLTSVSGNGEMEISGNRIIDVSGNGWADVSGGNLWGQFGSSSISGNLQIIVSGNGIGAVSGYKQASISDNGMDKGMLAGTVSGNTLLEKRKLRGSYMETRMQNQKDLQVIKDSSVDFSNISIACLGDSITQAANLDNMEDYQQYAYPARLKEILSAEKVTNLGIGGSSIGRYWDAPFVDRFKEIPDDTDLIIVMGGTNDGFCLSQEELGTIEDREANTFIGDLDELMRGMKENYPDATIVFATPLPNVLHDMLRKERDYLLPQVTIVNVIKYLAEEYDIPVIDLYNSNILDTHDAAVIYNYMPDGVHCNPDGYALLAEHFAAELIALYEEKDGEDLKDEEASDRETSSEDGTFQEEGAFQEEGITPEDRDNSGSEDTAE